LPECICFRLSVSACLHFLPFPSPMSFSPVDGKGNGRVKAHLSPTVSPFRLPVHGADCRPVAPGRAGYSRDRAAILSRSARGSS